MKVRVWHKKFKSFLRVKDEWFLDFDGILYFEDMMDNELLPVSPNLYTVQRYTELHDVNGKELWEGDLVSVVDNDPCEIVYEFGRWMLRDKSGESYINLCNYWTDNTKAGDICSVTKIGNKYEKTNF